MSIDNIQAGINLISVVGSFFSGKPYHTADVSEPAEAGRLQVDGQTLAAIWSRRGQPEFRARLLQAYGSQCAITECNVVDALEAAHIIPFSEERGYAISNGILLRADIHTLFDLFLISIDPSDWTVYIAPSLAQSYRHIERKRISLPSEPIAHPDSSRIKRHYNEWQARWH